MSKEYREKLEKEGTVDMRKWCQRPGKVDEDGKPVYFTEQSHKNETDINKIIRKYDKTGLITHISKIEQKFGDVSGVDFKQMQDKIALAKTSFEALPSEIRNRFENEPHKLLEFMDNPSNRDEAIELGLIKAEWTEETDGIGEHIKTDEERVEKDIPPIAPPAV